MGKWKKFMQHYIMSQELELRIRLFRMTVLIGLVALTLASVESIIVMREPLYVMPMIGTDILLLIGMVVEYRYHKSNLAVFLVGIAIIMIALPSMFMMSGGIRGGVPIWLIWGYVYTFLMFTGWKKIVFILINVQMNAFIYGMSYHHPPVVRTLSSTELVFADSLFSVIVVGILSGIVFSYQIRLYINEYQKTEEQKKQLESASDAQNLFFASMSHEIRTPMNSIIGLNELIIRRSEDEEILGYAKDIESSGKLLLGLINDVLDMSQLKQKRLDIVESDYETEEMFRDVAKMMQIRMAAKKLDFTVNIDETLPRRLHGDVKRIQQILVNVLSNAAKYTEKGSVWMNVTQESAEDGELRLQIVVGDTGIGIRKEDLDKLYDKFLRVDMQKNMYVEGSGLGLAITKQLVELMHGNIKVDSIYTKGTNFTITIPQKIIDGSPVGVHDYLSRTMVDGSHYSRLFEAPEGRILIVDDNEINSVVVSQLLKDTKLQIDIAGSGARCLEMTKEKFYNVILMDYMMPEMSGAETYKLLRKQENGMCHDTPVIVLTATGADEAKSIAAEYGFTTYLEKPIDSARLESQILQLLPKDIIEYQRVDEGVGEQDMVRPYMKRKKKLLITTDCVADIPKEIRENYDIRVMYLYIRTAFGRFTDTREIESDNLAQILSTPNSYAVADSASMEEYEEFFAQVLTEAEEVIHISMASRSGRTYGMALAAAQGFDHVRVVDSGQVSCGEGLLVLRAAQLVKDGCSSQMVLEGIEKLKPRVACYFTISDIEAFGRNGYVKPFVVKLLRLLATDVVVKVNKRSKLSFVQPAWGARRLSGVHMVRQMVLFDKRIEPETLYVTYTGYTQEQLAEVIDEMQKRVKFKEIIIEKATFSSACNAGTRNLGIAVMRRESE